MTEAIGYHAHVYFDAVTRPVAERLRETIAGQFTVELGGFSDEPRGPHPVSQFMSSSKLRNFRTSCRG